MRFKDAMRDHSVGDVAEAWLQLVATCYALISLPPSWPLRRLHLTSCEALR